MFYIVNVLTDIIMSLLEVLVLSSWSLQSKHTLTVIINNYTVIINNNY